jgi:hypothetical protein
MSGFCYETHPLGAIIRRPKLAMDAAPTTGGNLIDALLKFAAAELTREQAARLNNLIEDNTGPTAAVAQDDPAPLVEGQSKSGAPRKFDPENVERACAILRAHGVSNADVDQLRKICGVTTDPAKRAMDAAIRATDRLSRAAPGYAKRFPEADHIEHGSRSAA